MYFLTLFGVALDMCCVGVCVVLIDSDIFSYYLLCLFFFFFQAEDGIRDLTVTGVQTCALPIFYISCLLKHDYFLLLRIRQQMRQKQIVLCFYLNRNSLHQESCLH